MAAHFRRLVLLAVCVAAGSPCACVASRVRGGGGGDDDSPSICQLKALAQAQNDIIVNCGSKNAVITEWNECRMPILERAQRKIAETCCRDAVGASGCEDASLPTETYETDSPGGVPPKGATLDDDATPA
jgi:hypothetical protein